ncbi:MAG: hypothetical protein PWR01_1519, partial [Clostridiales bacterium]|nr:hypothetical protein [Clostridiales bacterium]
FVCENRIKSRGEAEKLSPGICKNKALGLFESVLFKGGGCPYIFKIYILKIQINGLYF